MCSGKGLGRIAEIISSRVNLSPGSLLARVARRRLPEEVLERTVTFERVAIELQLWRTLVRSRRLLLKLEWSGIARSGRLMAKHGYRGATHILSSNGDGGELLYRAKAEGLKVLSDVVIAPSWAEIVLEEARAYPDWTSHKLRDFQALVSYNEKGLQWLLDNTDVYLSPSRFVTRDLVEQWGVLPASIRSLPYPIADHWFHLDCRPVIGRVLFVGTADIRKGIHYLAMAAQQSLRRRTRLEFRVIGSVDAAVRHHELARNLNFLGLIPREEVSREFAEADVLVLPSLAEGSATVVYEALASGIPVVTTPSAGSIISNGVEGYIVRERDPSALCQAIEAIVEDRLLRDQMSMAARKAASGCTWDAYAHGLLREFEPSKSPMASQTQQMQLSDG